MEVEGYVNSFSFFICIFVVCVHKSSTLVVLRQEVKASILLSFVRAVVLCNLAGL
jgi:hypothetical protein